MRVLKSLGISLWKEWRDQRAIVIGIFVSLPVLTGLAFWAFGGRLLASKVETQFRIFLPVALGLVFFAVAADLVAGEKRRETLDFLRRLPGGLTRSFAVKWFFLLALGLAVLIGQALLLALAWRVMAWTGADGGQDGIRISRDVLAHLGAFPLGTFWQLALVGLVLPSWAFVVSTWLGRSGAAAIASLLVLAAVLAPWAFLVFRYPWFLPFGPADVPALTATFVAVAVLVSGVSYLGGLRFRGAVWKPALWGLLTAFVLTGAGYAYARVELRRWTDFDSSDPDLFIQSALVAEGGRKIYLNVSNGRPVAWGSQGRDRFIRASRFSMAWIFDVQTGEVVREATEGHRRFLPVPAEASSRGAGLQALAPHGILLLGQSDPTGLHDVRWIDAATGETIDIFDDPWTRSPAIDAALREDARRHGYHVDARGRRVWIRDWRLEREGELPPLADRVHVVPQTLRHWSNRTPCGWTWSETVYSAARKFVRSGWSSLDAETGEVIDRPGRVAPIDRSLALKFRERARRLVDLQTEADRGPARHPPLSFLGVVGERRVLGTYRCADGHGELRIWDPVSGETRLLKADVGLGADATGFALCGRASDGRYLLFATHRKAGKRHVWIGVMDSEARILHTIASIPETLGARASIRPLVLEDDGALVAIEGNHRFVRLGRAPDQRGVVFPR